MFKDYNKYLKTSFNVYVFVLFFIFILKLVGMNCFDLDVNNPLLVKMDAFCLKYGIATIYSYFNCFISFYILLATTINDNSKKMKKFALILLPLTIIIKYSGYVLNPTIYFLVQIVYPFLLIILYTRSLTRKLIKRYIVITLIINLFQFISIISRGQHFSMSEYNFVVYFLLDIDYFLMLIIYYRLFFEKGGKLCHHYQMAEAGSSLLKKINLKQSLKRLQVYLHKFKQLSKEEKLSVYIYIFLSLLWNTLSLVIILLIANLNNTFIECLFILTSFWLSKGAFGKAFHLSNMFHCFIVSNITYYVLNRITTPLGISIFVPILLGVGLSYITSKLVKKTYKPLYKGMPKDLFEETILKVVDKDSLKYKICYGFYINKKSDLSLSFEYNYSIAGIRKIKDRINEKIKKL